MKYHKTNIMERIYRIFCTKCEQLSDYDFTELVDPEAKCKICGSNVHIDFTVKWNNVESSCGDHAE